MNFELPKKALVIGGGIGGLAAAVGLRQAGWSVEVYERAPALEPLGAGLSLWANALRALDGLGLGETAHAWHLPHFAEERSGLRRSDGEMLVPISPVQLAERFGVLSVGVHRAVLQEALLDALGREHLHLGRTCTGSEEDEEGVTARFEDGTERRGDLLVGADGLHSVIRAALHGPTPPASRPGSSLPSWGTT